MLTVLLATTNDNAIVLRRRRGGPMWPPCLPTQELTLAIPTNPCHSERSEESLCCRAASVLKPSRNPNPIQNSKLNTRNSPQGEALSAPRLHAFPNSAHSS